MNVMVSEASQMDPTRVVHLDPTTVFKDFRAPELQSPVTSRESPSKIIV